MLQWLLPDVGSSSVSIPQAVWIACNEKIVHAANRGDFVSIPQAVWIACNYSLWGKCHSKFSVSIPQAVWIACNYSLWGKCHSKFSVSIPQAVWIACNPSRTAVNGPRLKSFQYRKRYGLHAIGRRATKFLLKAYEFQYRKRYGLHAIASSRMRGKSSSFVSIPQAVWIACNTVPHSPWDS